MVLSRRSLRHRGQEWVYEDVPQLHEDERRMKVFCDQITGISFLLPLLLSYHETGLQRGSQWAALKGGVDTAALGDGIFAQATPSPRAGRGRRSKTCHWEAPLFPLTS